MKNAKQWKDYSLAKVIGGNKSVSHYTANMKVDGELTPIIVNEINDSEEMAHYIAELRSLKANDPLKIFIDCMSEDTTHYAVFRYAEQPGLLPYLKKEKPGYPMRIALMKSVLTLYLAYAPYPAIIRSTAILPDNIVVSESGIYFNICLQLDDKAFRTVEQDVFANISSLLSKVFSEKEIKAQSELEMIINKLDEQLYTDIPEIIHDLDEIAQDIDERQTMGRVKSGKAKRFLFTKVAAAFAAVLVMGLAGVFIVKSLSDSSGLPNGYTGAETFPPGAATEDTNDGALASTALDGDTHDGALTSGALNGDTDTGESTSEITAGDTDRNESTAEDTDGGEIASGMDTDGVVSGMVTGDIASDNVPSNTPMEEAGDDTLASNALNDGMANAIADAADNPSRDVDDNTGTPSEDAPVSPPPTPAKNASASPKPTTKVNVSASPKPTANANTSTSPKPIPVENNAALAESLPSENTTAITEPLPGESIYMLMEPGLYENFIGGTSSTTGESAEGGSLVHTVKYSDTMSHISIHYYNTANLARALADYNQIDNPSKIFPGQKIIIPDISLLTGN